MLPIKPTDEHYTGGIDQRVHFNHIQTAPEHVYAGYLQHISTLTPRLTDELWIALLLQRII